MTKLKKVKPLFERQKDVNLRHHDKSCYTCRYFRMHANGSDCLYLGRAMGSSVTVGRLVDWARTKICDAWKKRPSTWNVYASKNPYWEDEYISRETQEKLKR